MSKMYVSNYTLCFIGKILFSITNIVLLKQISKYHSLKISNTTLFSSFIIASKRDIILRERTGQPKLPVVAMGNIG